MRVFCSLVILLASLAGCAYSYRSPPDGAPASTLTIKFFSRKISGGIDAITANTVHFPDCEDRSYVGDVRSKQDKDIIIPASGELVVELSYETITEETQVRVPSNSIFRRYDSVAIPERRYPCSDAIAFSPEPNTRYRISLDEFAIQRHSCEALLEKFNAVDSRWELENSKHVCTKNPVS